jgi:hypothetical protein
MRQRILDFYQMAKRFKRSTHMTSRWTAGHCGTLSRQMGIKGMRDDAAQALS